MPSSDEMLEERKLEREAQKWVLKKAEQEGREHEPDRLRSLMRRWWKEHNEAEEWA